MLIGQLALTTAAIFTGAALYVIAVEQPARLALDDRALLAEWKPSYNRGYAMQAPLALLGFALAAIAWWQTSDWQWLLGGLVLAGNWPYTLLIIRPTNDRLMAADLTAAGPETRALIVTWGGLHGGRVLLGAASVAILLWASIA